MASEMLDEKAIFNVARKIDSPEARAEYLHQVCGTDGGLSERVDILLKAYEQQASFLELSPAGSAHPPSGDQRHQWHRQNLGRHADHKSPTTQ